MKETAASNPRVSRFDSLVRSYGVLLVPAAMAMAALCFRALNSEWLLAYCAGSFAFSAASFRALKRNDGGKARHFARVVLGTTACLSVVAALHGLAKLGS